MSQLTGGGQKSGGNKPGGSGSPTNSPSGGSPVRAGGARAPGVEEATEVTREKLAAGSGIGRGQIVGAFEAEGEADRGEVSTPGSVKFAEAVQEVAEEVKDEQLPVEYKEIVERYYESLLRGRRSGGGTGGEGN